VVLEAPREGGTKIVDLDLGLIEKCSRPAGVGVSNCAAIDV
jgi:hypothetical protein